MGPKHPSDAKASPNPDLNIGYQAGQIDGTEKYKAALRAVVDAWDTIIERRGAASLGQLNEFELSIANSRKLAYPQQGTTRDGQPWCHQCPDGECVGREKIDGCDIRKPEGGQR